MKQSIRNLVLLATVLALGACATYQGTPLERYTEFTKDGVTYSKCSAAYPTGSLSTSTVRMDKIVPKQASVGKSYTYQFIVTNLRNNSLRNVVITDDLNPNFKITSSSPQPTTTGATAKWVIPELGAYKQYVINVTGTAGDVGTISSCGSVSYDDQVCATTTVVKPGLKAAVTAPASASMCDIIPLVYTATNIGNVALENVYIDGGKTSELVALDGTRGGQMLIGSLAPGESKQIKVDAKSTKLGNFNTVIRAVSGQISSEEARAVTLVKAPVLKVAVSAPGEVIQGRTVSYEVTVTNEGDGPATNVVVTSPVPAGTSFISASNGGTATANVITWPAVNMGPKSATKLRVDVRPVNTAIVRTDASAKDTCAQPASASAQTSVKGVAAILLEVVDDPDPIEVGGTTTYTIIATNQGSAPDSNISIVCTLEDTQSFVSASGATNGSASGPTITFAPLPTLGPKATATWKVVVKGVKASDTRFKTTMNTDQLGRPVEETEATKIY
jgi:uncharacterized repeat protein (TIGR01451 family)